MNYKKRYKEALERAVLWHKSVMAADKKAMVEDLFPELKEPEDENKRISKEISQFLKQNNGWNNEWLTWLEKQGQEPKKVSIWKHWKNGICGNGEGKQTYLIKMGNTYSLSSCLGFECDYIELSDLDNLMIEKQGKQKQSVWSEEDKQSKNWILEYLYDGLRRTDAQFKDEFKAAIAWFEKQYEKESDPRYKCLEDLLTADDIHQMSMNEAMVEAAKSKAVNALSKLGISKLLGLEKQSKKLEPKFHPGDWIIDNNFGNTYQIETATEIESEHIFGYTIVGGGYFNDNSDVRLWTINDAKDGDVLAGPECYVMFKEIDGLNIKCYCTYHYMGFNPSFHVNTLQNKEAFHPATKEQCDILFAKMREAGYVWDSDNKELKRIEVASEESEDERIRKMLHTYIHDFGAPREYFGNVETSDVLAWLEKKGEQKTDKIESKFKVGD